VQQPAGKAGVAAVAASVVLNTPVEGSKDVRAVAEDLGATASYTVDPLDTRFTIECASTDLPRLLGDLSAAIARPDLTQFSTSQSSTLTAVHTAVADPVLVAYAMIRQAQYAGTGYADPDAGRAISLAALGKDDVASFVGLYRNGHGTVVSLAGDVTADGLAAARSSVAGFAAGPAVAAAATTHATNRGSEIVAHRDVAVPWVAVGYSAPSQFSPDFAAMLVIEALLGRGGDVHAFSYGSDATPPDDFVGGYYQYEAQPGSFIEFYNGANVDQDLRDLSDGIGRLRTSPLAPDLLDQAKRAALGAFLTSVTTLDDRSWLLGRSAVSPSGAAFENRLPAAIAAVTAADVERVARAYLTTQTVAVVLPNGVGQ
jgi:zinc protease